MLTPLLRAFSQLDDPRLLGILVQSILLSALCFIGLCFGSFYGLHHALSHTGWIAWAAGILGGLAGVAAALWLFVPLAVMIASLFINSVCAAVENRFYPGLPPARGASFATQLWDSVGFAATILGLNLICLLLALLLPGIGLLLGWGLAAWGLGRSLFMAVAMRRMDRAAAQGLYRARRLSILFQGAALTAASYIPPLNLLVPVVGCACMAHVLMQPDTRRG